MSTLHALTAITTWPRRRRCPICGAPNYACGGPTTDHIVPVDQRKEHRIMASDKQELQEVEVTTPSGYKTTVRTRNPERYQRMERAAEQQQKSREEATRTRARAPQTRTGDVETK